MNNVKGFPSLFIIHFVLYVICYLFFSCLVVTRSRLDIRYLILYFLTI